MIESDNEPHDDNHKPVKGRNSTEATSELYQYLAYFFYHDIPQI